jgi:hypothetical protein
LWKGATYFGGADPIQPLNQWGTPTPGRRPIDAAFPEYHYLVCETQATNASEFQKMFFQAWKANQSFALNGLKVQPNAVVLAHVLRLWNAAHSASSTTILTQTDVNLGAASCADGPNMGGLFNPTPIAVPNFLPPYYLSQVASAVATLTSDDKDIVSGTNLVMHTGPRLSPPKTAAVSALAINSTSNTAATVAKVAGGTVVAAAAGIGIYAAAANLGYGYAAGKVLDKVIGGIKTFFRRL